MSSAYDLRFPTAKEQRAKYNKTHTCKGDSLRVNLYREKPREFNFSVGLFSPQRIRIVVQRWRVVCNGVVIGWIGKIPPIDNCLLRLYPKWKFKREWACWYADNHTDKPNISPGQAYCTKKRRNAVEQLVKIAHPKHRSRLGWSAMWFSLSPPWYSRKR